MTGANHALNSPAQATLSLDPPLEFGGERGS